MERIKKVSYKYQVLIYFSLLLTAVTLGFSYLFMQREREFKMERLTYTMIPYTDLVYNNLSRDSSYLNPDSAARRMSSILPLIPEQMRITVLTPDAWVIFDNLQSNESIKENHLNRPELNEAKKEGYGSELRYSNTLKAEYLYYAKRYPKLYVRAALDYNSSVLPVIVSSNRYMVVILILFLSVVLVLVFITKKISRPVSALREFIDIVKNGRGDFNSISFPNNELGEVGEEIVKTFRQLDETKKYKQELTHNVAHELKTPVTGIRGYLETLLQQENIDKDQSRFFLERAYAQTLRLSSIINDISILNKIEESPDKFDIEPVNIRQCLLEIESDLAFKLEEKKIVFSNKVDDNIIIKGSSFLIYSLFKNLIDNSIEHGGEKIEICTESKGCDSKFAYFCYYDTGKGVSEEHLDRIFERFYRVEKSRSRKSGGSGLGLSIVKNAIKLQKGNVTVSNRPGGGLKFEIALALEV